MEHLPKRTSLARETAATLKEWISTGVLRDVLPGELQLAARLEVGRDTLRLALKLLADEGWVSSAWQGKQRKIQAGHPAPMERDATDQLPVTLLSPYPITHRITLLEIEATQRCLAEAGRSLRFVAPDIFHLKGPDRHLERLVQAHPSVAWILYAASEPVQRWFDKQGIPAFLYQLPFPDVKLPYVAQDWEAAAFHAGIQLLR